MFDNQKKKYLLKLVTVTTSINIGGERWFSMVAHSIWFVENSIICQTDLQVHRVYLWKIVLNID